MAEIHKLTKNGETIYPATTTDAVVHPGTQTSVTKLINEYNVSILFPTGGTDGTDKYTLTTAISVLNDKLTTEQKVAGLKLGFKDDNSIYKQYTFNGDNNFTDTTNWTEFGPDSIDKLNKNTGISDYEEFSDQKEYKAETTVLKDGLLKTFITDHAAGVWDDEEVEEGSLKNDLIKLLQNNIDGGHYPIFEVYNVTGGTELEEDSAEFSGLYTFGAAINEKPYYQGGYKSYRVSFTDSDHKLHYIAFKPSNADRQYRTIAIFDNKTGDILLEKSIKKTTTQWFVASCYSGQTLLVTSERTPLLDADFKFEQDIFNDITSNISDITSNIKNFPILSVTNILTAIKTENYNDVVFQRDAQKVSVSWGEHSNSGYYFIRTDYSNGNLYFYKDSQFILRIKNTGQNTIKIVVALSPYIDWSKGLLTSKTLNIEAGSTVEDSINIQDFDNANLQQGSEVYPFVILYGQADVDAFANEGSIELQVYYIGTIINAKNAENADKATSTDNSLNAGWTIGAYSKDAKFRDIPASGGSGGAITIEQLDERTVKLTTNFNEGQIGSRYRGIYWKINYANFDDIKGIWELTNIYNGYTDCRILPSVGDWGNGIDVIDIDKPIGGKIRYDFYNTILNFKEKNSDNGKWTGVIETQGYFYVTFIKYSGTGLGVPFNDVLTLDHIPSDVKVIATDFDEDAEKKIKELAENSDTIQVTNWGDSLTAGAGSSNHTNQETVLNSIKLKGYSDLSLTATNSITYSIMMQNLLGDKYHVTNCGVGGENINTIAARLGANLAYPTQEFTLPIDTTAVNIGNTYLASAWGENITPLLQGGGNSVNPCYVQGIECTLQWTGSNYTIQRVSKGDREITFSVKTPIILSGSKLYRNTKLSVIWCWQNGGYSDDNELIEKLDKIINHVGTQNYLIIGLHSGTAETRQAQEELLSNKYGDKFFNWREYVSTNAMYDFGLSPTEEDLTEMAKGSIPKSLLHDNVHLCAAGYAILGYKIIERFKDLGYIE